MTKVAGYIRVSSAVQVEGESLDNQRKQIEAWAEQKGWELVDIYADEGQTGTKVEFRTQFQQMMNDAKKGKFQVIVFYKLSRFARNAREYMNIAHDLKKHGVILASVKENIDPTTQTGRMIAGILALFAEWEHETIREQMYENKMARWKDNRAFVGSLPFGYKWNNATKEIEVNESEAQMYRRIVNMYLNQGMPYRDIAIQLNREGLQFTRLKKDGKERQKRPWSDATIMVILRHPAYYGNYVVNQYYYIDTHRGAGTRRSKEMKPESEQITFNVPPLITKTEWDRIQQTREFRKVRTKRGTEQTHLFFLRDVCVCGRCGATVKPVYGNRRKDGTSPRYYRCYYAGVSKKSIEVGRSHKCTSKTIKADELERAVWSDVTVMFALNPQKAFEDMFNPVKYDEKIAEYNRSISNLESELRIKNNVRKNLFKLLELDGTDVNEVQSKLRSNKDEILTTESTLSEIKERLNEIIQLKDQEGKMLDLLKSNKDHFRQLRNDISKLSPEDKKILIEAMLIGKVTVDYSEDNEVDGPGGVEADFKLRINPEIIQRFIDEGKISRLNQNSPDHSATLYAERSPGNNKNPFSSRENRPGYLPDDATPFPFTPPYHLRYRFGRGWKFSTAR